MAGEPCHVITNAETGETTVVMLTEDEIVALQDQEARVAIPQEVTKLQFKIALLRRRTPDGGTLLDTVSSWLATQPKGIREAWSDADMYRIDSPVMVYAAAALGVDDDGKRELFAEAAKVDIHTIPVEELLAL